MLLRVAVVASLYSTSCNKNLLHLARCATSGGKGEVSAVLFSKIEKSALILQKKCLNFGKKCPVCMHFGLNSNLKCTYKSILEKKDQTFSLRGPPFVCLTRNVYQSPSISRKLPCPKKIPGGVHCNLP